VSGISTFVRDRPDRASPRATKKAGDLPVLGPGRIRRKVVARTNQDTDRNALKVRVAGAYLNFLLRSPNDTKW
jgi:hypothetical protein